MARKSDPSVRRRWQSLVAEQSRSGMTIAEFCDVNEVSTASFYLWRRKLQAASHNGEAFVAVEVIAEGGQDGSPFRVRFDNGAVVEIPAVNVETLLRVVDNLAFCKGGVAE